MKFNGNFLGSWNLQYTGGGKPVKTKFCVSSIMTDDDLVTICKGDNFFEKRVTEYSVVGMEGDWGWDEEPEVCGLDGRGCAA